MNRRLIRHRIKSIIGSILSTTIIFFTASMVHYDFDLEKFRFWGDLYVFVLILSVLMGFVRSNYLQKIELRRFHNLSVSTFEDFLINDLNLRKTQEISGFIVFKPAKWSKRMNSLWGYENIEYKLFNDSIEIIGNEKNLCRIEKNVKSKTTI